MTAEALQKPESLKCVIAVRHGKYDDTTNERTLTLWGITQIRALASHLLGLVEKGSVVKVFSSPHLRATQSADIIAEMFQTSTHICQTLRSSRYEDGHQMLEELLSVRNGGDVLIAVTHCKAPSGIISAVRERFFEESFRSMEQAMGDGCMIQLQTGEIVESFQSSQGR